MIENIKQLESAPVARTNIVKLNISMRDAIKHLLDTDSNLYQIDFGHRYFKKERTENSEQFYKRLHGEIKSIIRKTLDLADNAEVKYQLTNLGRGNYVYFFINHALRKESPDYINWQSRINEITDKLAESNRVNKLLEGIFSLRIKISLLEKTAALFETEASYFNSDIYLNARYTPFKGGESGNGIIEAFRLSVYVSEQSELAFTLHKSKFLVKAEDELRSNLEGEQIWFNTASGRQNANRSLDARDSKLVFFKDRSHYGESQVYTHNVIMNLVRDCLLDADIIYKDITFQATHEVDSFSTDLDAELTNQLYIIEAETCFTEIQRAYFKQRIENTIPYCEFVDKSKIDELLKNGSKNSVLVLNSVDDEFAGFWKAFEQHQKDPNKKKDFYTNLKIQRLENWLNGKPFSIPLQGMNISKKLLAELDYIIEQQIQSPDQYDEDLTNFRSKLCKCLNSIDTKIKRLKTELWFKEALLTTKVVSPYSRISGHYTAFYTRSTKYAESMLVSNVEIKLDGEQISIVSSGVISGDSDWIKVEHPELERIARFYDNSIYLYDHVNDVLLTSYVSGRVPKIIGSASFDSVDWYMHQEEEKNYVENQGEQFNEYIITRSSKLEKNVLPYYLVQGRSKSDPLSKSNKLKHHRIYLMPHDEGVYYLVTHAQPANTTIAKQNLVENLILFDASGNPVEPFNHPLTGAFLNSFTLDMLKSGESSKTSIFVKLAKLLIEN